MEIESLSWVIPAAVAVIGIIKFKLIEEIVKKITPDDTNTKLYSILFLFAIVLLLSYFIVNNNQVPSDEKSIAAVAEEPSDIITAETPETKTDLEIKADIAKEIVKTGREIANEIRENKQRKDSLFNASKGERWAFTFDDWTDDEEKVLELNEALASVRPVKVIKQRKRYRFIKEYGLSKPELESMIDSLQSLTGLSIEVIDLNYLKSRKHEIIQRKEKFGKRKKKIFLDCLEVD